MHRKLRAMAPIGGPEAKNPAPRRITEAEKRAMESFVSSIVRGVEGGKVSLPNLHEQLTKLAASGLAHGLATLAAYSACGCGGLVFVFVDMLHAPKKNYSNTDTHTASAYTASARPRGRTRRGRRRARSTRTPRLYSGQQLQHAHAQSIESAHAGSLV